MAKRELEEINASSMADIAFLLLIFFLVTTTMNFPKAIEERLPQRNPNQNDIIIKQKNVLEILANANDQILIEGRPGKIEDIKQNVIDFYRHDYNDEKWPELTRITKQMAESEIKKHTSNVSQYPDDNRFSDSLVMWQEKLEAIELIGEYDEISDKAMVTIQLDNATKFKTYIAVLNEIMAGLNQLRDDLSMEKFGRPYNKLNSKVEEDKKIIKVLRKVYPKRIMKAKSRNAGAAE